MNMQQHLLQSNEAIKRMVQTVQRHRDHVIDVVCRAAMIKRYGEIASPESLELAKAECHWEVVNEKRGFDVTVTTHTMLVTASDMNGPLFRITETRLQDEIAFSWESFIGPLDIAPEQLKGEAE